MAREQRTAEPIDPAVLGDLIAELTALRSDTRALEAACSKRLRKVARRHRASAANLLHYLALRRHDLRELQERLVPLGLSSLGRAEAHAARSVDAVIRVLRTLAGDGADDGWNGVDTVGFAEGKATLAENTLALLGPHPEGRAVRIMVTMPSEAADDPELVKNILEAGMNCMRINCAHDGPEAWGKMIANLDAASRATGRDCRVLMDLPGPKLRTGPIAPGPAVMRVRPRRDALGELVAPARVLLAPEGAPGHHSGVPHVPVDPDWAARARVGDVIRFFDARRRARTMRVVERTPTGCVAELRRTAYLAPGVLLVASRGGGQDVGVVGALPPTPSAIVLKRGDRLVLTRSLEPGRQAVVDGHGHVTAPARVGVTLPEIFDDVRVGDAVQLDDGKIGGRVRRVAEGSIEVEITRARPGGTKLAADKGVNLPDTELRLPPLTEKDLADLSFVVSHADAVGYSFVRSAADVEALQKALADLHGDRLGIVLKIETRRAFECLPDLLLAAMRSQVCGVMIARGDLAVECGYERLAELQEEILWVCEAAHTPVIWATQVLENLNKEGLPSRAEVTDAAMGERAECVMLNKGPFVVESVRALDDILRRMQHHQHKKRSMLRRLRLAGAFSADSRAAAKAAR